MKYSELTATQLTALGVTALGLMGALYFGSAVGSGNLLAVVLTIGVIPAFVAFVHLKQMIWVLIPIGWYLTGRVGAVPLPLTVQEITTLAAIAAFALFALMRQVPVKTPATLLDRLVYLNIAYVAFVFVRHPAGLFLLQTEQVGGRAYLSVLLAFGVFLVLSRARLTPFVGKFWPLLALLPLLFSSVMQVGALLNPSIAPLLASIYGQPVTGDQQGFTIGEQRLVGLQTLGTVSVLALASVYPPLSLINPLYPARMGLLLFSMMVIFLSGFRLAVLASAFYLSLSLIIRRQLVGLWIFAAVLAVGLTFLLALQSSGMASLPLSLQRSLSFLPGEWHPEAKRDANQSTQWRLDMWQWAWEDDRILRDKIWGQGFGLSLEDMQIEATARLSGRGEGSGFLGGSQQEWWLINGAFHNGPLSAIRNVGVVGLLLYLALVIVSVRTAWAFCIISRDTYLFPMVLFIALPIMWEAFRFVFLYGHYPATICLSLYWAGLLNLVRNNLPRRRLHVPLTAHVSRSVAVADVVTVEPIPGLKQYNQSKSMRLL